MTPFAFFTRRLPVYLAVVLCLILAMHGCDHFLKDHFGKITDLDRIYSPPDVSIEREDVIVSPSDYFEPLRNYHARVKCSLESFKDICGHYGIKTTDDVEFPSVPDLSPFKSWWHEELRRRIKQGDKPSLWAEGKVNNPDGFLEVLFFDGTLYVRKGWKDVWY